MIAFYGKLIMMAAGYALAPAGCADPNDGPAVNTSLILFEGGPDTNFERSGMALNLRFIQR
jgi:hypothetical protein